MLLKKYHLKMTVNNVYDNNENVPLFAVIYSEK